MVTALSPRGARWGAAVVTGGAAWPWWRWPLRHSPGFPSPSRCSVSTAKAAPDTEASALSPCVAGTRRQRRADHGADQVPAGRNQVAIVTGFLPAAGRAARTGRRNLGDTGLNIKMSCGDLEPRDRLAVPVDPGPRGTRISPGTCVTREGAGMCARRPLVRALPKVWPGRGCGRAAAPCAAPAGCGSRAAS